VLPFPLNISSRVNRKVEGLDQRDRTFGSALTRHQDQFELTIKAFLWAGNPRRETVATKNH
jgi:hypothetical protein